MNNLTVAKLKEAIDNFEKDFKANGIDPAEVPVQLVPYRKAAGNQVTQTTAACEVKYTIGQAGIILIIC